MKVWIAFAAFFGALSVALGAYTAHGFDVQTQSYEISLMEKATRYQMYHALALLAVAWLADRAPGRAVTVAGSLFVLGVVLFCGSLYGISLAGAGAGLGGLAPLGGTAMIAGWLVLGWAGWSSGRSN